MGINTDRKQMATLVKHFGPVVTLRNADAAGVSRGILRRLTDRGDIHRLAKANRATDPWFDGQTVLMRSAS